MELDTITCSDALQYLKAIPDEVIDMILTSPPYDNLRTYNGYSWNFEGIALDSYRVLKTGGVLVWVVGDSFTDGSETLTSFEQALYFKKSVGFNMHQRIVWQKEGMPHKRPNAYLPDFEDIFVLSKGTPKTFNPITRKNKNAGIKKSKGSSSASGWQATDGKRTVNEVSILTNVWLMGVGYGKTTTDDVDHPAMFPEKLAERHIMTWTNAGDTVLDYFAGSGTTLKMARNLNRRYLGCDISEEYVALARKRLALPYTVAMFTD